MTQEVSEGSIPHPLQKTVDNRKAGIIQVKEKAQHNKNNRLCSFPHWAQQHTNKRGKKGSIKRYKEDTSTDLPSQTFNLFKLASLEVTRKQLIK